ncbi:hypothetical protein [Candidatus Williamhamiltonella defendens]
MLCNFNTMQVKLGFFIDDIIKAYQNNIFLVIENKKKEKSVFTS